MKRVSYGVACTALFMLLAACGGGAGGGPEKSAKGETAGVPKPVSAEAKKGFEDALQAMVAHDKANDWTDATCTQIAKQFLDASSTQKSEMKREFPEALYNAGLAYQRCKRTTTRRGNFKPRSTSIPSFTTRAF